MNRDQLQDHIFQTYGAGPEHPWMDHPGYVVFRHGSNRKWFAVIMDLPVERLGLPHGGMMDVVNLKCDPLLVGSLRRERGFFPAYHMNKANWITVALDGSVESDKLKWLLELSHSLTAPKRRNTSQ